MKNQYGFVHLLPILLGVVAVVVIGFAAIRVFSSDNSQQDHVEEVVSAEEINEIQAPSAVLLDESGNEIQAGEGEENVAYNAGESVSISGNTVAFGEVTLYVYSEPKQYTVTADENGVWSYVVDGLEAGEHRVEVEVTNPETGRKSERVELFSFRISEKKPEPEQTTTAPSSTKIEEPVDTTKPTQESESQKRYINVMNGLKVECTESVDLYNRGVPAYKYDAVNGNVLGADEDNRNMLGGKCAEVDGWFKYGGHFYLGSQLQSGEDTV